MSASKEKSTTRTAPTAFGEIEYETVECASCGTEVRRESARQFVVGKLRERDEWHTIGKDKFTFQSGTVQTGWACEYCREQGVFGFPDSRLWDIMRQYPMVFLGAALVLVVLLVVVLDIMMVAI